jgi:hypothetical protein
MQDVIDKIKELIDDEGINPSDVFLIMKTIQDDYYDEWLVELDDDDDEDLNDNFEDEIDDLDEPLDAPMDIPNIPVDYRENIELEDSNINLGDDDGNTKTE